MNGTTLALSVPAGTSEQRKVVEKLFTHFLRKVGKWRAQHIRVILLEQKF